MKTFSLVKPQPQSNDIASHGRACVAAIVGSWLIAISAQITVPMYPVPMTMQTWAVLLIPALFGARVGVAAALLYLAQGAMGAPFFAGGASGITRLMGPTGGFLMAFPVAALIVGVLMVHQRLRTLVPGFFVLLLGHAVVFAGGVAWLSLAISLEKAIAVGLLPFLIGTVVKSLLAIAMVQLERAR